MVNIEEYGDFKTAWCPGCGNHSILKAMKLALVQLGLSPFQVLFVSGIGQAAKAPHYLDANLFNGLHGRALPAATGAKLSNPELTVIVESGDGCSYGEGGNHFLAAIRRNINVTLVVHNNQIYALTKGQASPTSQAGFVTKSNPQGVFQEPFNPVAVAVTMRAGFVARGFSGHQEQLIELIIQGVRHSGFSLIEVLQPCVSFNKVNTFTWYQQRCYPVPPEYDPTDRGEALKTADQWGDRIPTGVIYRNDRPPFESNFSVLKRGPLAAQTVDRTKLAMLMQELQ
jgi:2-oxoglutarate/2-oxoacid ferredoxin oxidoreductase subunit beta